MRRVHPALSSGDLPAIPLHLLTRTAWAAQAGTLPAPVQRYLSSLGFAGQEGEFALVPDAEGAVSSVFFGLGENADPRLPMALSARLPPGDYRLAEPDGEVKEPVFAQLFAEGTYRFTRYSPRRTAPPRLILNDPALLTEASALAHACDLLRDLVNTPAADMGPSAMESAAREVSEAHGAALSVIIGDDLLAQNYPMIHAVGRAATEAPRLLELVWGDPAHPTLALVGKGVSFDSGGLNIKPATGMRDMKKDMGGAAHALALAQLVMSLNLPVRLVLLIPAVENAISGNAFRPGDVLNSRKGTRVEIDNTDAEGRLILADALTRAQEHSPELLMDFATLTGAARVALGPDLAPYYTDDADLAAALEVGALTASDPVWRMPLWKPYTAELKSSVCELVNSGGPMAGSVTAALFLQHFVSMKSWLHFDIWAWRQARYGRPAGAAACGLRASWDLLKLRFTP